VLKNRDAVLEIEKIVAENRDTLVKLRRSLASKDARRHLNENAQAQNDNSPLLGDETSEEIREIREIVNNLTQKVSELKSHTFQREARPLSTFDLGLFKDQEKNLMAKIEQWQA